MWSRLPYRHSMPSARACSSTSRKDSAVASSRLTRPIAKPKNSESQGSCSTSPATARDSTSGAIRRAQEPDRGEVVDRGRDGVACERAAGALDDDGLELAPI